MAELGVVTRTLLSITRDNADDRELAARICGACVEGLDVDGAAISLLTARPVRHTLAVTDATAELLEDLQFTLNDGACMEAATTGRPVLVGDLYENTEMARWPVFAAAVAERTRVRALFALPLQWGVVNLGVLDLYRFAPGMLPEAQLRDAMSAADAAALMMLGLHTDPGDGKGGWLEQTVGHRAEIHQATGMVLIQLGVSAADALARMRGYAFVNDRLLIDVARDIVARKLKFTEDVR
jgi:GAF domain/ANTAR domain